MTSIFGNRSNGKLSMRVDYFKLAIALGVTLSLGMSGAALKIAWDSQLREEDERGNDPYMASYQTDEQAAQEEKPDGQPVFQDLTEAQIARRALTALCNQIQCANLKDYVFSFERDGLTAAGAFWYRPVDPKLADPARKFEHFLCRFQNESWVICYVGSKKGPDTRMVFARAPSEAQMKLRDLDKTAELRKRDFPKSN
jgi:hypothetical protein